MISLPLRVVNMASLAGLLCNCQKSGTGCDGCLRSVVFSVVYSEVVKWKFATVHIL